MPCLRDVSTPTSTSPANPSGDRLVNWAGNHTYTAGRHVVAGSVEEAQQVVAESEQVRVLGTRHSFNALADTAGTLLDLTAITAEPELDTDGGTVRVAAGTPYRVVASFLQERGLALANLGSLPHISVGGACATGTHGSGAGNRILGAGVRRLELIAPDGSLRAVEQHDPDLDGSVVALGALGAVTRLDLEVEPTYLVQQDLYGHLAWTEAIERVTELLGSAYSVSVFGRWNDTDPTEVLVKHRVETEDAPAPEWPDGVPPMAADAAFRLLPGEDHLTLRGAPGPWAERLPHFRGDRQPSFGDEIQTEWFVDADDAVPALRAVTELTASLGGELEALLAVTELRAVRADELWLSPAQGRETVALHFTWRNDPMAVLSMALRIEDALAPYAARPHWGKVHGDVDPGLYPRLDDFRDLRDRVDPAGKFLNDHVARVLGLD